jgi:hypothetical protein
MRQIQLQRFDPEMNVMILLFLFAFVFTCNSLSDTKRAKPTVHPGAVIRISTMAPRILRNVICVPLNNNIQVEQF